MFVRTPALSLLASLLLALGCYNRGEAESSDGTLVVSAPDASRTPVAGSLTLTGLDHPLHARVALPRDPSSRVQLPLPPGLYAVQWIVPALASDPDEPFALPFETRGPQLIVIASGQVSSVYVRVRAASIHSGDSASGAPVLEPQLALR